MNTWLLRRRELAQLMLLAGVAGATPLAMAQPAPAGAAAPRRFALLVGVSDYPSSEPKGPDDKRTPFHLNGPKNDVQLIRTLLSQRGFAPGAVQVLADGVPDAGLPTRSAILAALDGLTAQARPGDFIFLYFAGHGSQMPANPATPEGRAESDGLHEIFLPRDVGQWNGSTGAVDNAIVDYELNRRLDALLAKDTFVWAIFDACHSATLMRSVSDPDVRYRYVDPAALGVTPQALQQAEARAKAAAKPAAKPAAGAVATRGAPAAEDTYTMGRVEPRRTRGGGGGAAAGSGGFVAFYAAQTTQTTPEMRLPAGDPERKSYGLFGYSIAEALSAVDGITYRQLSQYILQRYSAQNIFTPTPLFTGSQLDAPVFGSQAVAGGVRQWPLAVAKQGITVRAGLLSQLNVGTQLLVLANPLAPSNQALGTLRVEKAEMTSATLVPVADGGKPALDPATIPKEAVARLVQPATPGARLRVIAPAGGKPAADAEAATKAVQALQQAERSGIEVQWVKPGEAHDLRLVVEDGQLWLAPPTGQFYASGPNKTHSIRIQQPEFQKKLAESLQYIGRAQNLLRIASALQDAPGQRALAVEATLTPPKGAARKLSFDNPPQLSDGDLVKLTLRNPGKTAIDLTALYIDASYGISALYPQPGSSNRIEAGGTETIEIRINAETTGVERLLLIAVEARSQGERSDFSFLQQNRLERTRGGGTDMTALLSEAGFGPPAGQATRGVSAIPAAERTDMRVLSLRVK
jgi:hypothetical protein